MRARRGERFVLCVDLGTGGPKVGLVSLRGEVVWSDHVPVSTRHLPGGGAVQDAQTWWDAILDAARRGLSTGPVWPEQVVAVSCTGQWASTVPVDADGTPVGDCLLWMDTRGAAHASRRFGGPLFGYAPAMVARWVWRTGGAPSLWGADPIGHILYLEDEEPETARAVRYYLEPVDYLSMRFSGRPAASLASMTASWLTDNRNPRVPAYDPALVRRAGVPLEKLPPLVVTGSVLGPVRSAVAGALGLAPDVVVVAGMTDLHAATVGSGSVLDYETHLAISTTSWVSCPVPAKKTDTFHQIAAVPGVSPDHYIVANNHETGGVCLEWLRGQLFGATGVDGTGADGGADRIGSPAAASFDALTSLAATAPVGSGNVIFTPWLTGERSPVDDRNARGGLHNMSLATSRADLVRAVLEGVAYNNRWLYDSVERLAGRRLDQVRVIGGGAVSDLWCQIHADVLGRTVERVADPARAQLRGAALWAAMALGVVSERDLRDLVRVDRRFDRDPATGPVYDRLYGEFPRLYRTQRPMFARLNGPAARAGPRRGPDRGAEGPAARGASANR